MRNSSQARPVFDPNLNPPDQDALIRNAIAAAEEEIRQAAWEDGYNAGYDAGYESGYDSGYENGQESASGEDAT